MNSYRTPPQVTTIANFIRVPHLGYIAILADKMDKKLLTIKIIYVSESLRQKTIVWLSRIAKGIKNILQYAHNGLKEWQNIETRDKYRQLNLKL